MRGPVVYRPCPRLRASENEIEKLPAHSTFQRRFGLHACSTPPSPPPRSVCRGGGGLSSSSLVRLLGHLLALTTAQSATRRPRVGGPRPPPPPFRFQSFRLSVVCVGFLRRRQRLHLLLLCYSRRDVTTLGRRRQPPLGQSSNGTGNETDNKRAPRTDLTSEKIETLEQLENGRSKCAEGGAKVAAYNKVVTEVAHALSSLPLLLLDQQCQTPDADAAVGAAIVHSKR